MKFKTSIVKKIILSLFLFLIILLYKPQFTFAQSCGGISQPCCAGSCLDSGLICNITAAGSFCMSQIQIQQQQGLQTGSVSTSTNSNSIWCDPESINTAIGCIPVGNTNSFMGWILGWAVGVGGGIAFLLIVYASIMIMTSQGMPDRLKAGQELLTSAISGLIMLIFSVFILNFIGIDILGIFK